MMMGQGHSTGYARRGGWPALAFVVGLIVLSAASHAQAHSSTMRAGILADFPPLYVKNRDGAPRGLAIDVLDEVADKVGFDVDYQVFKNWAEGLEALRTGQIDFMPGVGYSEDRAQEFLFSAFMETVPVSLFVRAGTMDVHSVDDLRGRPVAVIKGSVAWELLRDRPHVKLAVYETIDPVVVAMLAGEVEGFLFPEWVMWKKLSETGLKDRFKIVGKPLIDLHRGWLFPKYRQEYVEKTINPVLTRLVNSPRYLEIHKKWYGATPSFWSSRRLLLYSGAFVLSSAVVFYLVWSLTIRRMNRRLTRALEEQRGIERQLREGEERYRTLFKNAPVGIGVAGMDRVLRFVNSAFLQIFGYEEAECVGQSVLKLHPPQESERHRSIFRDPALPSPLVLEGLPCVRKGGELFHCDMSISPMRLAGAQVLVGFFVDTTEKHRLTEELRQQEKLAAIGQLAGGIAHDFNNQLAGILGYAELLSLDAPAESEMRRLAQGIITGVHRTRELNKQILAFARKGKMESKDVKLHELLTEVVALLQHSIDKRIVIVTRFEAAEPYVQGDPSQLQNAFLNLALNARDAMPDGGTLTIQTRDEPGPSSGGDGVPDRVRVVVEDTGCGMGPEVKARLFEPFFTTKEKGKGTGMGLAAVYGTVRSHEGEISIDSEPGKGTRVIVLFPARRKPEVSASSSATLPALSELKGVRVLVVDDEARVRDVMRRHLLAAGAQVDIAVDGLEAIEKLSSDPAAVDVVLLDLIMPNMDGQETFQRMRALRPDLRVLLVSGYSADGQAREVLRAGALGLLQKPFRREELLSALRSILPAPGR